MTDSTRYASRREALRGIQDRGALGSATHIDMYEEEEREKRGAARSSFPAPRKSNKKGRCSAQTVRVRYFKIKEDWTSGYKPKWEPG